MNEKWINDIRERLIDYKKPAPDGLWEDIERAIEEKNISSSKKTGKKVFLWSGRIAAVAAMVALLFLIVKKEPENNPTAFKESCPQMIPAPDKSDLYRIVKESKNKIAMNGNAIRKPLQQEVSLAEVLANDTSLIAEGKETSPKEEDSKPTKKKQVTTDVPFGDEPQVGIFRKSSRSGKLTTDFYVSNSSNATKSSNLYGDMMTCNSPLVRTAAMEDVLHYNIDKDVQTKVKHEQPIRLGLNLRYHLNDDISIKGGISYSRLVSHITSGSEEYRYETKQTLHFVGIPLGINYSLFQNKSINVYASAGGMVEKCVSGHSVTDYVIKDHLTETERSDVKIHPLQWSVNASAGLQYNVSPQMGLYAEPGVNYYFNNGSPVNTIYGEKPLNFNLEIGLRFSIK